MFIAEMYSYGKDKNCVGVDGIVDCIVLYDDRLFAIHIPCTTKSVKTGWEAFANYFAAKNPTYTKGARLYAVVNGGSRPDAEAEVRQYAALLNAKMTFIRLTADTKAAAAVLCQRSPHTGGVDLMYRKTADAGWVAGTGKARAGFYSTDIGDHRYGVSSTDGWQPIASPVIAKTRSLNSSTFSCSIM
jgi:hypothetical protein